MDLIQIYKGTNLNCDRVTFTANQYFIHSYKTNGNHMHGMQGSELKFVDWNDTMISTVLL